MPETFPIIALDWVALLQQEKIIGLVLLGVVAMINFALVSLIFHALFGALRDANNGWMTTASIFSLVGITLFFATKRAFAPIAAWLPMSLSAPFRLIWIILIAIGLFRLARRIE